MNRAQHIQSLVEFVLNPQASEYAQRSVNAMEQTQPYAAAKYASDVVKHYAGIGDSEWKYEGPHGTDSSPHQEIINKAKDAITGFSQGGAEPPLSAPDAPSLSPFAYIKDRLLRSYGPAERHMPELDK